MACSNLNTIGLTWKWNEHTLLHTSSAVTTVQCDSTLEANTSCEHAPGTLQPSWRALSPNSREPPGLARLFDFNKCRQHCSGLLTHETVSSRHTHYSYYRIASSLFTLNRQGITDDWRPQFRVRPTILYDSISIEHRFLMFYILKSYLMLRSWLVRINCCVFVSYTKINWAVLVELIIKLSIITRIIIQLINIDA